MHCRYVIVLILPVLVSFGCDRKQGGTPAERVESAPVPEGEVTPPDSHSSRTSLDWAGTYSGVLPCASCPGIETEVTLNADGTYRRSRLYIGEAAVPMVSSGSFSWDATGSRVVLEEGGDAQQYQVGENVLFHLDKDGSRVSGDLADRYQLEKHVSDAAIEQWSWRLVELRGRRIDAGQVAAVPVLQFDAADSVISGNASCNSFSGAYALKPGNRIRIGRHLAVTMMACADMSVESEFLDVLRTTDGYAIGDDGILSLHRARMAPLARFGRIDDGR